MRIATLFSGCGAPEQAAARVWRDHEVVFACEWNKFARQSYLANYEIDEAHFHTDVRDFPDTFKQVVSNSQLYKQAGNSMTVAVVEMIFRQIDKALKKEHIGGLF